MIGITFNFFIMKRINLFLICLMALAIVSCSNLEDKMRKKAVAEIGSKVHNPDDVKIIGFSTRDSAFDVNYYSKKEIASIMKVMDKITETIMARTENLTRFNPEDSYVIDLAERQMKAMAELQGKTLQSEQKGNWNGWKIRVDYQAKNKEGKNIKAERWFFFDKKGENIIDTFEIPLP